MCYSFYKLSVINRTQGTGVFNDLVHATSKVLTLDPQTQYEWNVATAFPVNPAGTEHVYGEETTSPSSTFRTQ